MTTRYATGVLMTPPVVTMTAYIPSSSVGAVIGRRGQNVEDLQRKAAAAATTRNPVRVSVVGHEQNSAAAHNVMATSPSESPVLGATTTSATSAGGAAAAAAPLSTAKIAPTLTSHHAHTGDSAVPPQYTYSGLDFSDPAWTPVVIRGDVEAALAAGRGLADTCTLDEVVLDVPLPCQRHAAIIGKNGRTLAKLSGDHAVRIMIPFKQAKHDMIQLEGDLPNVSACLADLLSVATNNSNNGTVTESLVLPRTAFSQSRLRALARRTDCRIKKKSVGEANWQIFVTGKASQVAAALHGMRKWKDTASSSSTTATAAATTTTTNSDASSTHKSSPATPNQNTKSGSGSGNPASNQKSNRRRTRRGGGGGGNNNSSSNNRAASTSPKGTPSPGAKNSVDPSTASKKTSESG